MFKRILKEPLIHFFVIGFAVFVAFNFLANEENANAPQTIVVERQNLVDFLQFREKLAEPSAAEKMFDELPRENVQTLIDEYVENEALYREAKVLKLDEKNYATRQRLLQQLDIVNEEFIASSISFTETDLQEFLDSNNEKYEIPAKITFTHVFFKQENPRDLQPHTSARIKLKELNDSKVGFKQSMAHGDRFQYDVNYIDKEADEITSHFGSEMQEALFNAQPDETVWQGPFLSDHGFHLVMITKQTPAYVPALKDIGLQVEQDALHARILEEKNNINQSIIEAYDVEIGTLSQDKGDAP
jgi:hypothetical protein